MEGYATKTSCITRVTKKDVKFEWRPEQDQVRQYILKWLTSEPIFAIFDPNLSTTIHTDASSAGYSYVLMQTDADGSKRVVPSLFE